MLPSHEGEVKRTVYHSPSFPPSPLFSHTHTLDAPLASPRTHIPLSSSSFPFPKILRCRVYLSPEVELLSLHSVNLYFCSSLFRLTVVRRCPRLSGPSLLDIIEQPTIRLYL